MSWRQWHNSLMFCYVAQVGVVATTGYADPSPRQRRVEKPAEVATKGLFYPLQLPYYNTYSWNVCCSVFTSYKCPLISSQHLGFGDWPFSTLRWLFMPEQQVCRSILNWQWHPGECKMQKCSWTMLYDAKYVKIYQEPSTTASHIAQSSFTMLSPAVEFLMRFKFTNASLQGKKSENLRNMTAKPTCFSWHCMVGTKTRFSHFLLNRRG